MKHLFLESLEQTEQLTQNWFGPDGDNSFRQEEPQYTDLDDGTRLKAETSSELGEDWVNVSKVEEENPSKKIKEPQKKEKPEQCDSLTLFRLPVVIVVLSYKAFDAFNGSPLLLFCDTGVKGHCSLRILMP